MNELLILIGRVFCPQVPEGAPKVRLKGPKRQGPRLPDQLDIKHRRWAMPRSGGLKIRPQTKGPRAPEGRLGEGEKALRKEPIFPRALCGQRPQPTADSRQPESGRATSGRLVDQELQPLKPSSLWAF